MEPCLAYAHFAQVPCRTGAYESKHGAALQGTSRCMLEGALQEAGFSFTHVAEQTPMRVSIATPR
eukprot:3714831-Amphidinium_carterae.2